MKRIVLFWILIGAGSVCAAGDAAEMLINNVFVETDLRQALVDVSSQTRVPIIADPSVQGLISLELKDVPLEKGLGMMLYPQGFTFKKVDDYYFVTCLDPKSPSFNLISRTERVKLSHIKAIDAMYNLAGFLRPYVQVNKEKNVMTVSAPEEIIVRIKKDIGLFDEEPKQALIKVLVTEWSTDAAKRLGLQWGDGFGLAVSGAAAYQEDLSYQIGADVARQTLVALDALAQEGKVKIRANPRILARDTEEAVINIGTEKYVLLETGTEDRSYPRLQSVNAGIRMKIIPFIGEGNSIALEVETEVSDILPGAAGEVKLSVNRRSAKTSVHLKDGQTVGIGGLIQENEEVRVYRLPVLGKIPILGTLIFGTKRKIHAKTELVIFITPEIARCDSMGIKSLPD